MNKKKIFLIGILIMLFLTVVSFSSWLVAVIYATTKNDIGALLSLISFAIITIGFIMLYLGSLSEEDCSILWENENVVVPRGQTKCVSYPFHLDEQSVIKGVIIGRVGPYECVISEFFGTPEEMLQLTNKTYVEHYVRPKIHYQIKGPSDASQEKIGPIELPQGNYVLMFGILSGVMDSRFSLTKIVRKRPYENLYSFGLTLLEVGVPVLITGMISLAFGTNLQ
jgi:hypothetical protein